MVRTLKDAWHAGWRIKVRCFVVGPHHKIGHRPHIHCDTTAELDVKTLVWTRGNIPLEELQRKMRCPKCGNRNVRVLLFEVPNAPQVAGLPR
jgi:hypothetical protein